MKRSETDFRSWMLGPLWLLVLVCSGELEKVFGAATVAAGGGSTENGLWSSIGNDFNSGDPKFGTVEASAFGAGIGGFWSSSASVSFTKTDQTERWNLHAAASANAFGILPAGEAAINCSAVATWEGQLTADNAGLIDPLVLDELYFTFVFFVNGSMSGNANGSIYVQVGTIAESHSLPLSPGADHIELKIPGGIFGDTIDPTLFIPISSQFRHRLATVILCAAKNLV